jgi:hypothetical protein
MSSVWEGGRTGAKIGARSGIRYRASRLGLAGKRMSNSDGQTRPSIS